MLEINTIKQKDSQERDDAFLAVFLLYTYLYFLDCI